jgi:peptidoglycan hydrolase-like protein with peptidoglycan-binding domain
VDGQRGPLTDAAFLAVLRGQNLRNGANGYYVQVVQAMLNCWGYGLAIDGQFGPKTTDAATSFQRGYGLSVDGQVGPLTQAKLAS